LTVADLAVSRAGASVLGEFPLFGIPAILVPYPYAWRYQVVNAGFLEQKGAAIVLQDDILADELLTTIRRLIDDRNHRESMRRAMQALAKPDAAESIADLLYGLVSIPSPGRI
jgi:UDP-N-acetylglucosamine--N-acetylmuramyl-(pentapeptide) pyrophosphoryl-undecaprenol N-acetylglucosamine transferase